MSLPLPAAGPFVTLPQWRVNAGAAGVAVALHVVLAVALLGHGYTPRLPAPVVPVITTQLISVPVPEPVVEPMVAPEPPAPAAVEPAPPERVKAPAPVVPSEAELAFKREQQRQKQERVAEQKRQREESRQRQEQQRQEQLARETAEARLAEQRLAAERRAADERARAAAAASQQYLPITKKAPDYPQRALDKGIQGDCTVSYTVDTQGRVRDPQVVEGCHPWFAQPSLQAARSFRYQPRIVDGKAVEVPGIKNTFHYNIEQGSR
ncbi:energy transducer TonB [Pseudomonas putida CSV86]|uniref:Energy transducer TonB n=2 Tax=Pseudomonas TaxID=286 RepID=A0A7K4ECC6_9PSED|nr:energy transducer TonB [Pseudomonas bharatica]NNJ15277.1 energy transducer TonB [Pseudomonas bharatica CSV86]